MWVTITKSNSSAYAGIEIAKMGVQSTGEIPWYSMIIFSYYKQQNKLLNILIQSVFNILEYLRVSYGIEVLLKMLTAGEL